MKLKNSASLAALSAGLLGALALAATAGSAQAQTYSKIVVFGDSLSDNGNLPVGSAPPPPYSNGRFSNGDVWVQQLGFGSLNHANTGVGSVDWAFGGARTDNQASPPGMPIQLAGFQGAGGTFTSSSLVTVWGGANDIFQQIPTAAANPATAVSVMQARGATAANDIAGLVNQIAAAGAGTILVPNLPTLSKTPNFNSGPNAAAAPLADAGEVAFNQTLAGLLVQQAAAHPHTNIILMDVQQASQVFQDNAALFGFTNVTQACFNGVTVCSTPGSYLYWDGVHPTTAGHHAIAELALEYIYYGNFSAPTAAEGETSVRHRVSAMDAMMGQMPATFEAGGPTVGFIIDADQSNTDARDGGLMPSVKDKANSLRIVLNNPVSESWRWGAAFSATRSDVTAGSVGFHNDSYGVDMFGGWRSGSMFINATGGVGFDSFTDIKRVTMVAPLVNSGNTSGFTGGVKLQGGINWPAGGVNVSPRVAVSYIHGQVDGYVEDGLLVRQQYANRNTDATSAEATLRVETPAGQKFGGFIEAGYRDYLSYNADAVTASIFNNTALPLSTSVGKPESGTGIVEAGAHTDIWKNLQLGVSYRGRFGSQFHSNEGGVSLKWKF
ncbi:MAG: autotransporter domain-containing esterase [Proteobacteria bacterium]|nr:autotransporter domain-containing esterase [Pseudomonadota bacterium]